MIEQGMTPRERAQAIISEFADDYIMVIRVDGETSVGLSDPSWARAVLDQIEPAIEQVELALAAEKRHTCGGPE